MNEMEEACGDVDKQWLCEGTVAKVGIVPGMEANQSAAARPILLVCDCFGHEGWGRDEKLEHLRANGFDCKGSFAGCSLLVLQRHHMGKESPITASGRPSTQALYHWWTTTRQTPRCGLDSL
jgi:hypothetical protein